MDVGLAEEGGGFWKLKPTLDMTGGAGGSTDFSLSEPSLSLLLPELDDAYFREWDSVSFRSSVSFRWRSSSSWRRRRSTGESDRDLLLLRSTAGTPPWSRRDRGGPVCGKFMGGEDREEEEREGKDNFSSLIPAAHCTVLIMI